MHRIKTIWKFTRPHTVIGSVISIVTLFVIICSNNKIAHLPLLLLAIAIGITCNIFIVGINQIADVNIDKINKPYLPVAAGTLTIQNAKIITYGCLLVSLGLAFYVSSFLFYIILLSAAIGWAYSMPPLHLKKHHITAALAISIVRGILINIGGFMVFNYIVNKSFDLPADVKILAAFIMVFSIVISWFKDIPDMEGDSKYNISSLAIVYSAKKTFITGNALVALTYLITIYVKYLDFMNAPSLQSNILLYGHVILLDLFIINAFVIDLQNQSSIKKFYKRFWLFFFAEYLLYLAAYSSNSFLP
ncbi:MAG: homogentisate phytyltransferase [Bacteroidota bacterium]|nr:homogentisate phytyltransferase [Bacteroidota bacterium]